MSTIHEVVDQILKDKKQDTEHPTLTYNVISADNLKESDVIEWIHLPRVRVPYMSEVLVSEPGHIVFDGYFYLNDAMLPVERILLLRTGVHHVEIYEKKTIEDTSEFGPYDEEEGGRICFFPTAIIDLRYRIIKKIETGEEQNVIEEHIIAMEMEKELKI